MNLHDKLLGANFQLNETDYSQPKILQRMVSQLPRLLATHDEQDPTIALLDAWAAVLHVLSFYQQQYNQENYLTTATELRSIRELARSIGYELRPSIAASTFLTFMIEANANGNGIAKIPQQTKVQSVPSNGELPQTFETSDDLVAHAEWNQLKPYQQYNSILPTITGATQSIDIAGVTSNITIGDLLLVAGTKGQSDKLIYYPLKVVNVQVDHKAGKIIVSWLSGWANSVNDLSQQNIGLADDEILASPQLFIFRKKVACFGNNAPLWNTLPDNLRTLDNAPYMKDWDDKNTIPDVWQNSQAVPHDTEKSLIYLDQVLSKIKNGSFTLLVDGTAQQLYKVVNTSEAFVADFGFGNRVTILNLTSQLDAAEISKASEEQITGSSTFGFRSTTIYTECELLPLFVETSKIAQVLNNKIILDKPVTFLPLGKQIIVSTVTEQSAEKLLVKSITNNAQQIVLHQSPTNDYAAGTLKISALGIAHPIPAMLSADMTTLVLAESIPAASNLTEIQLSGTLQSYSELAVIENCQVNNNGLIEITLRSNLVYSFKTNNTVIFANVITATQGETINEVLGSGDPAQVNQRFSLKKSPVIYMSAPNAKGVQNSLKVYVDDKIYWEEAENLFDLTANDRKYIVEHTDNSQIAILFGDGQHGARLPNGQENIKAVYRHGAGELGNVLANSLSLMQTRPQGVVAVNNPLPASGGVAAETLSSARFKAPFYVKTLGRIVSLRDYIDFVQAYAGISKVQAKLIKQGQSSILFMTVASNEGLAITPDTLLYQNLLAAIAAISASKQNVHIQSYDAKFFNLEAIVKILPGYRAKELIEQIQHILLTYFSFEQRTLAQSVSAAEIMQVIQSIPGVVSVELDALYLEGDEPALNAQLKAQPARIQFDTPNKFYAAQLITINPAGIKLNMISS